MIERRLINVYRVALDSEECQKFVKISPILRRREREANGRGAELVKGTEGAR